MMDRQEVFADNEKPGIRQQMVNVGDALEKTGKIPFDPKAAGNLAVQKAFEMRAGRISLTMFDVDTPDPACGSYCSARHACRQPKGY